MDLRIPTGFVQVFEVTIQRCLTDLNHFLQDFSLILGVVLLGIGFSLWMIIFMDDLLNEGLLKRLTEIRSLFSIE